MLSSIAGDVPVITIPVPSDLPNSVEVMHNPTQQYVPPTKADPPQQPQQPPADLDMEFAHSLSAQEEISISGGGARQRLMQKLMRETRSRVIVLRNMVTVEEIDEYLEDEITEECNKYGKVSKVLIYQEQQVTEEFAPTIVKIFVMFTDSSGADSAVKAMNGRYFAGRPIAAQIYDQERFDYEDLAG